MDVAKGLWIVESPALSQANGHVATLVPKIPRKSGDPMLDSAPHVVRIDAKEHTAMSVCEVHATVFSMRRFIFDSTDLASHLRRSK